MKVRLLSLPFANIPILFFGVIFFLFSCRTFIQVKEVKTQPKVIYGNSVTSHETEQRIIPYREALKKKLSDTLIYNRVALDKKGKLPGLGQLVALAMLHAADSLFGKDDYVVWLNRGGLRTELPAGYLTVAHIYELMPFDNTICLKALSAEDWELNNSTLREKGFIITDKTMTTDENIIRNPKPGTKILLSDFLLNGGDGIRLGPESRKCSAVWVRDAIISYLKKCRQRKDTLTLKTQP